MSRLYKRIVVLTQLMHNRPSSSRQQLLKVKIFYLLFAGEFHHHNWKSNLFNNCKRIFERNWNGNQIFSSLSYQRSEKRNKRKMKLSWIVKIMRWYFIDFISKSFADCLLKCQLLISLLAIPAPWWRKLGADWSQHCVSVFWLAEIIHAAQPWDGGCLQSLRWRKFKIAQNRCL